VCFAHLVLFPQHYTSLTAGRFIRRGGNAAVRSIYKFFDTKKRPAIARRFLIKLYR